MTLFLEPSFGRVGHAMVPVTARVLWESPRRAQALVIRGGHWTASAAVHTICSMLRPYRFTERCTASVCRRMMSMQLSQKSLIVSSWLIEYRLTISADSRPSAS